MSAHIETSSITNNGLQFLWLELTGQCNLSCVHCYAESGPTVAANGALSTDDYVRILESASQLDCRKVQFIGGEPTLFRDLIQLIEHARAVGFELIELFTNAIHVSDELLDCLVRNKVDVATSFYCDQPNIHDAITRRPKSHEMTVHTLRRLIDAGLNVRAGIIVMEQNEARVSQTEEFLRSLGVASVGVDRIRGIGRGSSVVQLEGRDPLSELCGHCWNGRLSISPDGVVSPCTMSRAWPVGSVREKTLADILGSPELSDIRERIYLTTNRQANCRPDETMIPCWPDKSPCHPDRPEPCWPEKSPCHPDRPEPCWPEKPPCWPDKPPDPPPCTPTDPCMPKS